MRSMTGFGAGEAPVPEGKVIAEIRTVNSRHLEVRVRLPREMGETGMSVEQQIRGRLARGRCEAVVRLEFGGQAPLALDQGRARAALRALEALRDECAPGAEVPLSLLAVVPDLFSPAEREQASLRQATARAVERALGGLAPRATRPRSRWTSCPGREARGTDAARWNWRSGRARRFRRGSGRRAMGLKGGLSWGATIVGGTSRTGCTWTTSG